MGIYSLGFYRNTLFLLPLRQIPKTIPNLIGYE